MRSACRRVSKKPIDKNHKPRQQTVPRDEPKTKCPSLGTFRPWLLDPIDSFVRAHSQAFPYKSHALKAEHFANVFKQELKFEMQVPCTKPPSIAARSRNSAAKSSRALGRQKGASRIIDWDYLAVRVFQADFWITGNHTWLHLISNISRARPFKECYSRLVQSNDDIQYAMIRVFVMHMVARESGHKGNPMRMDMTARRQMNTTATRHSKFTEKTKVNFSHAFELGFAFYEYFLFCLKDDRKWKRARASLTYVLDEHIDELMNICEMAEAKVKSGGFSPERLAEAVVNLTSTLRAKVQRVHWIPWHKVLPIDTTEVPEYVQEMALEFASGFPRTDIKWVCENIDEFFSNKGFQTLVMPHLYDARYCVLFCRLFHSVADYQRRNPEHKGKDLESVVADAVVRTYLNSVASALPSKERTEKLKDRISEVCKMQRSVSSSVPTFKHVLEAMMELNRNANENLENYSKMRAMKLFNQNGSVYSKHNLNNLRKLAELFGQILPNKDSLNTNSAGWASNLCRLTRVCVDFHTVELPEAAPRRVELISRALFIPFQQRRIRVPGISHLSDGLIYGHVSSTLESHPLAYACNLAEVDLNLARRIVDTRLCLDLHGIKSRASADLRRRIRLYDLYKEVMELPGDSEYRRRVSLGFASLLRNEPAISHQHVFIGQKDYMVLFSGAEKHNAEAYLGLGLFFFDDCFSGSRVLLRVESSVQKGIYCLIKSLEGSVSSMAIVDFLRKTKLCPLGHEQVEMLTRALTIAATGNLIAALALANLYQFGAQGVEPKFRRAEKLYFEVSEEAYSSRRIRGEASNFLGILYACRSQRLTWDPDACEARRFFLDAIANGNMMAWINVGLLYLKIEGSASSCAWPFNRCELGRKTNFFEEFLAHFEKDLIEVSFYNSAKGYTHKWRERCFSVAVFPYSNPETFVNILKERSGEDKLSDVFAMSLKRADII